MPATTSTTTDGSTAALEEGGRGEGGGAAEGQPQQQHRQPLQHQEEFKDKDPERLIKMVRREQGEEGREGGREGGGVGEEGVIKLALRESGGWSLTLWSCGVCL
jgi:hypothetical protein